VQAVRPGKSNKVSFCKPSMVIVSPFNHFFGFPSKKDGARYILNDIGQKVKAKIQDIFGFIFKKHNIL
jgi:hypothetical protein